MAAPPLRDSAWTVWERLLLSALSVIRLAELLRAEGGVLRAGQAEEEWLEEGYVTAGRYGKCTTLGWDVISEVLVYASTRLGGIPVVDLEGNETLRGTERTEW